MDGPIPTFIVNKKERKDRFTFITNQFKDKIEFKIQIVNPITREVGAVSLYIEFVPHHLKNVADITVTQFLSSITPFFDQMQVVGYSNIFTG
ncbi:hypothetical protein [Niabella aquatica]